MKKLYLILCAALAIVACGKIAPENEVQETPITVQDLVFDFTVHYPGETKAVKAGWESGDKVFVFFEGVTTGYVTMSYSGSGWGAPAFSGTASVTDLTASGKKLTAIYLPFGNAATASYDEGWKFSTTYYSYYMRAEKVAYTVNTADGITTLSATMDMVNPDDYVQFFIEDGEATDGGYILGTDAVIPVGVAAIAADGTISETTDKEAKDDLPGYAYDNGETKGYIFSGKLVDGYNYRHDDDYCYYFAKTKVEADPASNTRADLFVKRGSALASHAAVKLPVHDNGRWVSVGDNVTVEMGSELGSWYTCNYGASVPEDVGTKCNWADASAVGTLPAQSKFETVSWSAYRTWMAIHGKEGLVVKPHDGNGFIFLPKTDDDESTYWSSTEIDEYDAYCLVFNSDGDSRSYANHLKLDEWGVRFLQN